MIVFVLEETYTEFLGNKVVCHDISNSSGKKSGDHRRVCSRKPQTETDGL